MMARVTLVGIAAVLGACGGTVAGSTGPAEMSVVVNGTISGQSVLAKSARTTVLTTMSQGQTVTSWVIGLSTDAQTCGCIADWSVQDVTLELGTFGTSVPTGEYSFGPAVASNPQDAAASAHYYSADCTQSPCSSGLVEATNGSITVSAIDAAAVTGTFDVSFPSGDRLTGTFTAPTCPVTAATGEAGACG
jgi:hypothetical protein